MVIVAPSLNWKSTLRGVFTLLAAASLAAPAPAHAQRGPAAKPPEPAEEAMVDDPALAAALAAAERIAAEERNWDARIEALIRAVESHGPGEFDLGKEARTAVAMRGYAQSLLDDGRRIVEDFEVMKKGNQAYRKALALAPYLFGEAEKSFRRFAAEETYEDIRERYDVAAEMWAAKAALAGRRLKQVDEMMDDRTIDFVEHLNTYLERFIPVLKYADVLQEGANYSAFVERFRRFKEHHDQFLKSLKDLRDKARAGAFDEGLRDRAREDAAARAVEQGEARRLAMRAQAERLARRRAGWNDLWGRLLAHAVYPFAQPGVYAPAARLAVARVSEDGARRFADGQRVTVYRRRTMEPVGSAVVTRRGDHLALQTDGWPLEASDPSSARGAALVFFTPEGERMLRRWIAANPAPPADGDVAGGVRLAIASPR